MSETNPAVVPTRERTRDFECQLCRAKFFRKVQLNAHILTHVQEKRFDCSECQFRTYTSGSLVAHVQLVHEKIRWLKCPVQGCKFDTASFGHLKKHHRVTHDPDPAIGRPLPCLIPACPYHSSCGKLLDQQDQNTRRTKWLPCLLCGERFYDQTGMKAHFRLVHVPAKHRIMSDVSIGTKMAKKSNEGSGFTKNCEAGKSSTTISSTKSKQGVVRVSRCDDEKGRLLLTANENLSLARVGTKTPVVLLQKFTVQLM